MGWTTSGTEFKNQGVPEELVVQGRRMGSEELAWLRGWIDEHRGWSRKRIAKELCQHWGWVDARGRLKDFAARSLLLKLEGLGRICLPPLQVHKRRKQRAAPTWADWVEPAAWTASLKEIEPVRLEAVEAGSPAAKRWGFYLERYHYLGLRVVGENLGYLATDRQGRDVGCLLFGAAAWKCAPRDQWLGWGLDQRSSQLGRITNNTRFLILPWVRVPHLASHLLGVVARRIGRDWQARYGHGLDWLESFVDRERFRGSCYRAANWLCVGQTRGRSRQDRDRELQVPIKDIYLYELRRRARP